MYPEIDGLAVAMERLNLSIYIEICWQLLTEALVRTSVEIEFERCGTGGNKEYCCNCNDCKQ